MGTRGEGGGHGDWSILRLAWGKTAQAERNVDGLRVKKDKRTGWAGVAQFSRFCFFCAILLAPQAEAQKAQIIRNDAGGNVSRYLMDVGTAAAFGKAVKIDGWCASACTLYLGSPYTCVTRRATLAFHAPRGGSAAQNRHAAQVMAAKLPRPVGRWFLQNAAHLTGNNHLTLSAQQLVRMGGARYC
ncbi:hypothetical protein EDD53_2963 [Pacificibacter maritimus]|uniref:Uncharacterized protein n=1 Tax=Pacificibacter maritimus TaxID=762213 RepID=A0A3N4UQG1_9RHOB|nr:hypothetical protein [Pacificibacter maritimus]RPE62924.1 hypothetical protein EDD53_2963 [Pacificibacter maritimus]